MIAFLLKLSGPAKRLVTILFDLLAVPAALWLALALRLDDFDVITPARLPVFAAAIVTALPAFAYAGAYRLMVRHLSVDVIARFAVGAALATLALGAAVLMLGPLGWPRSVILIYWFTLFGLALGGRLLAAALFRGSAGRRVAIYGAGTAGVQIAGALQQSEEFAPRFFIDDDPELQGSEVAGLPVCALADFDALRRRHGVREVLIGVAAQTRGERRRLLEALEAYPVRVRALPTLSELASGAVELGSLHDIRVEDLLGRDPAPPDPELLAREIRGKSVMVTGAGGSIGAELCRQIADLEPARLVMVEQSEHALYSIDAQLRARARCPLEPVLGSILDAELMRELMREHAVRTLYHAAAYKHVPLVERNIVASVRNNVFGTLAVARAAAQAGVEVFVLISTDKALHPSSVMGATKRVAEMGLQALAEDDAVRFCMVRFGNVLDSSGSVVPLFREQIKARRPVTVTHADMTRYFMTIGEAVELVIQAGAMARGGEVFALDMGEPINITDLAHKMIRLSGLQVRDAEHPDGDIEIRYTGPRPGEKIVEETLIRAGMTATRNPRVFRADERRPPRAELDAALARLEEATRAGAAQTTAALRALVARGDAAPK